MSYLREFRVDGCELAPIMIYDATDGSGICSDNECAESLDLQASHLYEIVKGVRSFSEKLFEMCGIDGQGETPAFKIHWSVDNAAWDPNEGVINFNDKYLLDEVVGHEYMHGIVSRTVKLKYENQSGALHEFFGDFLGVLYKNREVTNYKEMTWKIVDRDFRKHVDAMISNDEEPSELNDYGFVHANCRIPNHAFFCAVQNLKSLDKAVKIWCVAFKKIKSKETFQEFALKTTLAAFKTFGIQEASSVFSAWNHVKVSIF